MHRLTEYFHQAEPTHDSYTKSAEEGRWNRKFLEDFKKLLAQRALLFLQMSSFLVSDQHFEMFGLQAKPSTVEILEGIDKVCKT